MKEPGTNRFVAHNTTQVPYIYIIHEIHVARNAWFTIFVIFVPRIYTHRYTRTLRYTHTFVFDTNLVNIARHPAPGTACGRCMSLTLVYGRGVLLFLFVKVITNSITSCVKSQAIIGNSCAPLVCLWMINTLFPPSLLFCDFKLLPSTHTHTHTSSLCTCIILMLNNLMILLRPQSDELISHCSDCTVV